MAPNSNLQNEQYTILIVEDDADIADILERYLRQAGFQTERTGNGKVALNLFGAFQPDIVLLDVMLPEIDGMALLQKFREQRNDVVILIITALVDEVETVLGLEMGADDYITKPFRPREVLARIRAALRRSYPKNSEASYNIGNLQLDDSKKEVRVAGTLLELTATQYRVLYALIREPGRTISREELMDEALQHSEASSRVIDMHIAHLRKRLAEHDAASMLQTVRGMGYRLTQN